MDSKFYISFVVVARNDNYGGDFLHRINVFVKVLLTLCEKYELPSELIIVEWNPPEDRERLKDAISWPDIQRKYCRVRIIEVPNEVHKKLPNPSKLPLFEYIGKNVGVRRAKGQFVLTTNPDLIFSRELIRFLSLQRLSTNCFYRINRCDVKTPVPIDAYVEEILDYCKANIIRVHGYIGTSESNFNMRKFRAFLGYLKQGILYFPFVVPHTNASGDFLLMHKNKWCALRGYPEVKWRHHIDSLMVNMALFSKLRQVILRNPIRLYHQDHGRPEPDKPSSSEIQLAFQKMRREHRPFLFNGEEWGLGTEELPEQEVRWRKQC